MRNSFLRNFIFVGSLLFICSLNVNAQSSSGVGFKSGIRIATRTEAVFGTEKVIVRPLDETETKDGKDILHRRIVDIKNGTYTAYDIEVSRSSEANKFNVTIKSSLQKSENNSQINELARKAEAEKDPRLRELDLKQANQNLPDKNLIVGNGDIIKFEVLENPAKKYSIIDYIKIYDETKPFAISFSELNPVKDFTMDDVNLKLKDFEIFINGVLVGKMGGGSGPSMYFTVPGRGRIIISPFPREGYNLQKIGTIIDNKLTFTIGTEKYEIISKSPILGDGGNWNAWIFHDPNYQKRYDNPKYADSIEIGAGSLKFFFEKQDLGNLKK